MFLVIDGIRFNLSQIIHYNEYDAKNTMVVTTKNTHVVKIPIEEVDRMLKEAYVDLKVR
jgi:hypothetical protein